MKHHPYSLIYLAIAIALGVFTSGCLTTKSALPRPTDTAAASLNLKSPFYSSVPNLSIYNSHVIARDKRGGAKIIRGMRPIINKEGATSADQFEELAKIGVTDVLVLKDNIVRTAGEKGDVELEKEQLDKFGIRMIHLPIAWKNYTEFKSLCQKSAKIFDIFAEIMQDPNRKLFFHCTVGEDRTGFLTGLYKSLYGTVDSKEAFDQYMCRQGYADGNPAKPKKAVVSKIHLGLTPIYIELSKALKNKKSFDPKVCEKLPDTNPTDYWKGLPTLEAEYTCKTSDLYAPEIR